MPLYQYKCANCGCREQRIGGVDDHTAVCAECGGVMVRLDSDWFGPYFLAQEQESNQNQKR